MTPLYLAAPPTAQAEGWMHDCAALMTNDVELWIDACPHCGKPRGTATATEPEWTKASEKLPPCRDDQLYIGINTAGFAGVFNAVRVVNGTTYCLMEVAEESVSIMSDLSIWKPFNPPTSADGVEHG